VFAEHVFDLAADDADGAGGVGEFADDLQRGTGVWAASSKARAWRASPARRAMASP
jgi:hypothetical protein